MERKIHTSTSMKIEAKNTSEIFLGTSPEKTLKRFATVFSIPLQIPVPVNTKPIFADVFHWKHNNTHQESPGQLSKLSHEPTLPSICIVTKNIPVAFITNGCRWIKTT